MRVSTIYLIVNTIRGGVVNSVGVDPNEKYGGYPGLQRYYQPGRNFAASIEIRF